MSFNFTVSYRYGLCHCATCLTVVAFTDINACSFGFPAEFLTADSEPFGILVGINGQCAYACHCVEVDDKRVEGRTYYAIALIIKSSSRGIDLSLVQ